MAVNLETLGAGGPAAPVRPIVVSQARTRRRIGVDRWASRLVVVGGIIVIASILGILLVILAEAWPLFRAPTAELRTTISTRRSDAPPWVPASAEAFAVDEYREIAFTLDREGYVRLHSLKDDRPLPPVPIPDLAGARVTTAVAGSGGYLVGTSNGRVLPVKLGFDVTFEKGGHTVAPKVTFGETVAIDPE